MTLMQRLSLYVLCGLALSASTTASAQQPAQQPVPEPPIVYVPQDQHQIVYLPEQQGYGRPPRARRYRVPYYEGMEIPPGGEIITRRKIGLLVSGGALFGISWISTISAWAIASDIGNEPPGAMLVPGIGPFIAMGHYSSSTTRFGLAFAGTMQLAGLTMFAVGLIPRRYVQYFAGTGEGRSWAILPQAGAGNTGLSLGLRF